MNMENTNIDAFNSVNFLFGKPAYEGHYYYALDDVKNLSIIDKDSLRGLLTKLGCADFIRINYLLDRNLPLFYRVKEKVIDEFELIDSISKEEVNNYIKNELSQRLMQNENPNNYDRFFGKNSNFYKQNFNEESLCSNKNNLFNKILFR